MAKLEPQDADLANEKHPTRVMRRIFYEDSVCVKKCPVSEEDMLEGNIDDPESEMLLNEAVIIPTTSVMDICWPVWDKMSQGAKDRWVTILEGLQKNMVFMQLMNLYTAWKAIAFSMFMALVLSITYIYFLSIFAEYVAWGLVFFI